MLQAEIETRLTLRQSDILCVCVYVCVYVCARVRVCSVNAIP